MRLMLLKAASAPSELLEAYTLNTVAVVTDVKSKLCPFLGTGWWPQHVTGGEKAKTFPLLSQDRDALLKAEKFYIPFQQDRTTFKACFHLKSSCAKTLASLTDTSLSLWGCKWDIFPVLNVAWDLKGKQFISFSCVISVTLSCRSRGAFADTEGPFADTHAVLFFQALLHTGLQLSNHNTA